MSCIKKILILVVLAALGVFLFTWFGFYNVAANNKHWDVTTKFLGFALHRSVKSYAKDIPVPDLTDNTRIERGATNYDAMCATCHLAPGLETSELYEGMYPQPPVLYKDEDFASKPNEDFWIIKNGIKMTGMPAWGLNNSDEQIWDMIALIKALDSMSPEQYKKLVASGKHTHKDDAPHVDEKPHGKEDAHDDGASKMQKNDGHADLGADKSGHADGEGDHTH